VGAVAFGSDDPLPNIRIGLSPLGLPNAAAQGPAWSQDTARVHRFENLAPGGYSVVDRSIGHYGRTDTITIGQGRAYALRLPIQVWDEGHRNVHNCRPRGFRRNGESACAASGEEADGVLAYARHLSRPEERATFKLPPIDSTMIALVDDEMVCERAGRLYGRAGDPPRRVVVVRMGTLFFVYDPFEPLWAGEWDIYTVFSADWNRLVDLAS